MSHKCANTFHAGDSQSILQLSIDPVNNSNNTLPISKPIIYSLMPLSKVCSLSCSNNLQLKKQVLVRYCCMSHQANCLYNMLIAIQHGKAVQCLKLLPIALCCTSTIRNYMILTLQKESVPLNDAQYNVSIV